MTTINPMTNAEAELTAKIAVWAARAEAALATTQAHQHFRASRIARMALAAQSRAHAELRQWAQAAACTRAELALHRQDMALCGINPSTTL